MKKRTISVDYLQEQIALQKTIEAEERDTDNTSFTNPRFIGGVCDMSIQEFTFIADTCEKVSNGVFVQASTLGSLGVMLSFLVDNEIPMSGINIGPVYRKDVIKASILLERESKYAVLIAFDVPITDDARIAAEQTNVKIIAADVIFHLIDRVREHFRELEEREKNEQQSFVVWPCRANIIHVCKIQGDILLGVKVLEGQLKIGTPLIVYMKDKEIGRVVSIQKNGNSVESANVDDEVSIRLDDTNAQIDRHVVIDDLLCSILSRQSIDVMKKYFRTDLNKEEWALVIKIKSYLKIA